VLCQFVVRRLAVSAKFGMLRICACSTSSYGNVGAVLHLRGAAGRVFGEHGSQCAFLVCQVLDALAARLVCSLLCEPAGFFGKRSGIATIVCCKDWRWPGIGHVEEKVVFAHYVSQNKSALGFQTLRISCLQLVLPNA
jgi:hypothetical protein